MTKQTFYRVSSLKTNQGLWYDQQGTFTGLIHNDLNFCTNNQLQMPFNQEAVGYLSVTKTLEELYLWFTKEDIVELQKHGYSIVEYQATDYKFHENHWLINQETSVLVGRIHLSKDFIENLVFAE